MQGKFERTESESNIKPYKKKASTPFAWGDPVFVNSDGLLEVAVANSTAASIVGVIQRTVASTDADYASESFVEVDVPRKGDNGDLFRVNVGTGTASQTSVGETHDLTSGSIADLNATSTNVIKVQRFLTASQVLVSFM